MGKNRCGNSKTLRRVRRNASFYIRIIRNFEKGGIVKGAFAKTCPKWNFEFEAISRALRVMYETEYQQFCADLARAICDHLARRKVEG